MEKATFNEDSLVYTTLPKIKSKTDHAASNGN